MTKVLRVDARQPAAPALAEAAECLRSGGLVAFPTETVYGLGADATSPEAVRRVFEAKGRPANDPLIVHVARATEVHGLVATWPTSAEQLTRRFWPGPLTVVVPKSPAIPEEVTAGLPSVALRCPDHPVALALLLAARLPVAAPSANLFSRPSPTTAQHVLADLDGRIALVLDGGPTSIGVESTVVDLTGAQPRVLRPGGVPIEALAEVLGTMPTSVEGPGPADDEQPSSTTQAPALPSPGLLERHYSPRTPMVTLEGPLGPVAVRLAAEARREVAAGHRVGLLIVDELVPAVSHLGSVRSLGPAARLDLLAAGLYAALRGLDTSGVDVILASSVGDTAGLGAAVRDRLRRAAAGRVITC